MCKKGKEMLNAVEAPVVRHSLHYRCGVYKEEGCREPIMSMHIDNDCSIPLVKVLLVAGGVMLVSAAVTAAVTSVVNVCTCKKKHCSEDC